jgi:hypothetical protein
MLGDRESGRVIVAGDRKTPAGWTCPGVKYLSPDAQTAARWRTTDLLPWNHYARKVAAYLHAIEEGAEAIIDIDDDNIPHEDWGFPDFEGEFLEVRTDSYYNVYRRFTESLIWPRGFPLRYVTTAIDASESLRECTVAVWQGLAAGDPDVDAIYRLTVGSGAVFSDREPVVLAPGTACPFNSQNTLFSKQAFPLLYLPATVTFRSTDIVRAFVAQPILWTAGYQLGFVGPNVTQERNEHDPLHDFESEVPLYLGAEEFVETARGAVHPDGSIAENLRSVYRALADHDLVGRDEVALVDAWLTDLATIRSDLWTAS